MGTAGKKLGKLFTPALVLERRALRSNQARMVEKLLPSLGQSISRFRPLVLHNSVPLATMQTSETDGNAIMTASLAQAELFSKEPIFRSILHSVPPTKHQMGSILQIHKNMRHRQEAEGRQLHIVVDNLHTVEQLETFCNTVPKFTSGKNKLSVLLKLDGVNMADLGGMNPSDSRAMLMVKSIDHSEHLRFGGVFSTSSHAMGRYFPTGDRRISLTSLDIAKLEAERVSTFVRELNNIRDVNNDSQGDGSKEMIVSVGSTSGIMALANDDQLQMWWPPEINEVHSGSYIFMDMRHLKHGTCTRDDCAVFVVTTVMGHSYEDNAILVDAGALVMGKYFVRMKWNEPQSHDKIITFGCVLEDPHMHVVELFPEFGIISSPREIDLQQYPVGSQMRIIPCHSGLTLSNFDRYHVVQDIHRGKSEDVELIDNLTGSTTSH